MLVEENVVGKLSVVDLSVDDYRNVLRQIANLGLTSGAIYDALHMDCARQVAADQIRHLQRDALRPLSGTRYRGQGADSPSAVRGSTAACARAPAGDSAEQQLLLRRAVLAQARSSFGPSKVSRDFIHAFW